MNEPSYLRRLRILAGLTLSEAAARLGVSTSHLSMAERGARSLGEEHVLALASLYRVGPDVAELAGGRVPSWLRDQLRSRPEEATWAAMDGFSRYNSAKNEEREEVLPDAKG